MRCFNLGLKAPYLDIAGLELQKATVKFEITTLEFIKLQNFAKKQHLINLRPKMTYVGVSGQFFKKTNVISEINTLRFV